MNQAYDAIVVAAAWCATSALRLARARLVRRSSSENVPTPKGMRRVRVRDQRRTQSLGMG